MAGGGGTGWETGVMYDAKKFFGFGNSSFIYPSGNIRERHGPHCKKRTDEKAVLCVGSWRVLPRESGPT